MRRLIAGLLLGLALPAAAGEWLTGHAQVLDGDTIRVNGITVRLKGVADPERAEPGGEAARAFIVELIEGETVICDLTGERTHGRRVGW